jgi:phospholipase/carboxylesterase
MRADDLAPFGVSMGLPGVFVFPEGPIDLSPRGLGGRAWWMIDVGARDAAVARGEDRDLSAERPPGLGGARDALVRLVDHVRRTWPERPIFLGGFSQGAILSLDMVVRTGFRPAGLVLLSGGRVDAPALSPLLGELRGIPIFQSHGRKDRELSFAAADSLRNELVTAGAEVHWWPFDGGHEIPLVVLRELKKFIRRQAKSETARRPDDTV